MATPTDLSGTGALDSTYELHLAFDDGTAVDTGNVLSRFVCTVNRVPGNQ